MERRPIVDPPAHAHRLDLRILRFRTEPQREEPALLAQALIESGRSGEAIELTSGALARDPADADVWLVHGIALARAGRLERAQQALMRAAAAGGDWVEPWRHLADVLLRRGRAHQALAVADRALAVEPDDDLRAIRASAHLSVRLKRFVQRLDGQREEPAMLAQELLAAGRVADAFEVTRTALASEVDDVDLLVMHARAAHASGDAEEAFWALRTASFEAPDWAELWLFFAQVQAEVGLRREALESVRHALGIDPSNPAVFALHARLEREVEGPGCAEDAELDSFLESLAPAPAGAMAS